jgi:hypothetical protein
MPRLGSDFEHLDSQFYVALTLNFRLLNTLWSSLSWQVNLHRQIIMLSTIG